MTDLRDNDEQSSDTPASVSDGTGKETQLPADATEVAPLVAPEEQAEIPTSFKDWEATKSWCESFCFMESSVV